MKISLFDGFFEFDFDRKAVVDIGIIILWYALLIMWGGNKLLQIIKKDKTLEQYDEQKIINACNKAARRAMIDLSDADYQIICNAVWDKKILKYMKCIILSNLC